MTTVTAPALQRRPRTTWPKGTWMQLTSPEILTAFMRQRGIGYERVARYAEVSKGFISHLAKGRRTTCSPKVAARIAEVLDVPLNVLFVTHASATSGQNINAAPKTKPTRRAA